MHPPPPFPPPFGSAVRYEEALVAAGWSFIGGGAGGRVYHRPGDGEVVKVVDGDVCYHAFVSFVLANPSACLPSLTLEHWDETNLWGVVHIERLVPLTAMAATVVAAWWASYVASRRHDTQRPIPADWSAMMDALTTQIPPSYRCRWDGKPENAMLRGATVVFTDPLF